MMKLVALLAFAALVTADLSIDTTAGTITDPDNGGIEISSTSGAIEIHTSDEVELEGEEIHFHAEGGEIHLEGEEGGHIHVEADGFVLIESNNVTHIDGVVTVGQGLGTSESYIAACGTLACDSGDVMTGIVTGGCSGGLFQVQCASVGVVAAAPVSDDDL